MEVTHIQAAHSDHVPILISTSRLIHQGRRKKFPRRFEESWAAHVDCERVIRESWALDVLNGSPMFCLFEKIKRCRQDLVDWSKLPLASLRQN